MDFQFYFKKMESSEALKLLARKKLTDQLFKIMGTPSKVHLTFFVEGNAQSAHCSITTRNGTKLYAEATSDNMYNAIDLLCHKLFAQVQRCKTRVLSKQKRRFPQIALLNTESAEATNDEYAIDAGDIIKMEAALRPYRERFLN
ncbi:ribosome hibernation-promoting factor, HPF/YfiA family [Pseudobacteriovorax antillogorgiicola]|uniref:Ribosomal subunit interface protein n=1 Tax=Pseudobacteriovorax antillogorgiicola TaxID=1513793 RepID=A0A1Y6C1P0_9BACT|nr:ribosome-associated translation inhibitor RaiA [Pseudobacteriovorax antillogorgiicola]TCS50729.1 ribosomal subunit interface protein [Pseudobacteriovorax antillogorgiicola]SMF40902.1 ribosomal subunit interface protein [Pseudobacteriovorax antillogorgiicola]